MQTHQIPALATALQAAGLKYNFQRYIIEVPNSILGLKNGTLYSTQGQKHIHSLTILGKSNNITGYHIQDSIEFKN